MAFEADDASEAGNALVLKAEYYASAGEFDTAISTLDRVPMFALDDDSRTLLLMRKAVFLALEGRLSEYDALSEEIAASEAPQSLISDTYSAASSYMAEHRPALKSRDKAFFLGFLPPAAHVYAGIPGEGVLRAAGDAASIAVGVLEAVAGNWVTAFLSCGIGLYECYWKGNAAIEPAVDEFNEKALNEFRAELKDYLYSLTISQ